MIGLSGELGKDLCDRHLPMSRRDVLKVGGSSILGLSLGAMLQMREMKHERGRSEPEPPESQMATDTMSEAREYE